MSTLFRTWTVTLNQAPASNATLQAQAASIFRSGFKSTIILAGYTVQGSSDATTAAMDATDRITADNKVNWGSGGTPWSWVVLKHPTQSVYILLSCSTGAANQQTIKVVMSSSAFTGGSTTSDPTSTASTFRNFQAGSQQFIRTPVANSHWHGMYNTLGDFVVFTSTDGVGFCAFTMGMVLLNNPEPNVTLPMHGWCAYVDSGNGGFVQNRQQSTQYTVQWMLDKTVGTDGGIIMYALGGTNMMASFHGTQGSVYNVNAQVMLPAEVVIQGTPSGGSLTQGIVGTLVDISWAPNGTNTPQAMQEPAGPATATTAKFGDFWVPCGGTTPVF